MITTESILVKGNEDVKMKKKFLKEREEKRKLNAVGEKRGG